LATSRSGAPGSACNGAITRAAPVSRPVSVQEFRTFYSKLGEQIGYPNGLA
jgi:hypothetical protein